MIRLGQMAMKQSPAVLLTILPRGPPLLPVNGGGNWYVQEAFVASEVDDHSVLVCPLVLTCGHCDHKWPLLFLWLLASPFTFVVASALY